MFLFAPIRWALRLPFLAVLAAAVYVVVSGVQVVEAANRPVPPVASLAPVRAVLVLGGPLDEGRLGPDLLGRLQETLLLYDAQRAPTLVLSGPPAAAGQPTATALERAYLVHQGVPGTRIDQVPPGDAVTALQATEQLFGGGARVAVVTDAVDSLWTKGAAAAAGLDPVLAPALGSRVPFYDELGPLLRQATGVAAGRVVGYDRASWAAG